MIDNKSVMQQALETLEELSRESDCNIDPFTFARWGGHLSIRSLREAIAQPEQPAVPTTVAQYSRCSDTLRNLGKSYPRTCAECGLGPCKTKPAQPEQTPIAYAAQTIKNGKWVYISHELADVEGWISRFIDPTPYRVVPLYSGPIAQPEQPAPSSALKKLLFKIDGLAGSGMIPWQIEDAYADYDESIAQPKAKQ